MVGKFRHNIQPARHVWSHCHILSEAQAFKELNFITHKLWVERFAIDIAQTCIHGAANTENP